MVETWIAGLTLNETITVAFGAVAALITLDLTRHQRWKGNPLATATVVLYVSCTGSHGVRTPGARRRTRAPGPARRAAHG